VGGLMKMPFDTTSPRVQLFMNDESFCIWWK
jgi:hypothetical protein